VGPAHVPSAAGRIALLTLPGLESFLIGECRALGVVTGAVGPGWVEAAADPAAVRDHAGTVRAVLEIAWTGPPAGLPARLPAAERLWFESQWINRGADAAEIRQAVWRAAGRPEVLRAPAGAPGLVGIVAPDGSVLIGTALDWGLERRRPYRVALMARSLNPAMARALAMAGRARPGGTCCDPFCGSGTVLAERAMLAPGRLVGVDRDAEAVDAAARCLSGFVHAGGVSADLRQGDARALDFLPPASVDAVCTNPPFGHRQSRAADNAALYPAALREAVRVLRPGGRLAVLTADRRHLRSALAACGPALRPRSEVSVWLGGLQPTLAVLDRTAVPPR
jgi:predicted RNA methylase